MRRGETNEGFVKAFEAFGARKSRYSEWPVVANDGETYVLDDWIAGTEALRRTLAAVDLNMRKQETHTGTDDAMTAECRWSGDGRGVEGYSTEVIATNTEHHMHQSHPTKYRRVLDCATAA